MVDRKFEEFRASLSEQKTSANMVGTKTTVRVQTPQDDPCMEGIHNSSSQTMRKEESRKVADQAQKLPWTKVIGRKKGRKNITLSPSGGGGAVGTPPTPETGGKE